MHQHLNAGRVSEAHQERFEMNRGVSLASGTNVEQSERVAHSQAHAEESMSSSAAATAAAADADHCCIYRMMSSDDSM
jgi:hypothetical protein